MNTTIIGMTGKRGSKSTKFVQAQAGKDTAAERLISHHGFIKIALADGVRDSLYGLNPLALVDLGEGPVTTQIAELVDALGWEEAKRQPEVRALMQRMGTEAGRDIHGEDLWTSLVEHKMRKLGDRPRVVVTDVRFPNEADWIRSIGGIVVEILRPQEFVDDLGSNAAHPSETMGWISPDVRLVNDSSIEALHQKIDRLMDGGWGGDPID